MLIFRRWGILVPVIFIAGAMLVDHFFNPQRRAQSLFFLIPAVLLFLTGWFLDKKQQVNDFFFIPTKYWGIIAAVFGIVILIKG